VLVDGLQYHPHRLLDNLVFQRGDTEWPCATIAFRDMHAPHGLRVVVATMHAVLKVAEPVV
jgi:hypothetical protein